MLQRQAFGSNGSNDPCETPDLGPYQEGQQARCDRTARFRQDARRSHDGPVGDDGGVQRARRDG
jgi:hypothetical protein